MRQFKSAKKAFGGLDANKASNLVAAATDLALVVDPDGAIKDLSFSDDDYGKFGVEGWIGKKLQEIVTLESEPKVDTMLLNAKQKPDLKWYQVNHPVNGAPDFPVRYRVLRLNASGPLLALGRDMQSAATLQQQLVRAQVLIDREHERSARAETRYQALFRSSNEAVLILNASNLRILEANPSCVALFSNGNRSLEGRSFNELIDRSSRDVIDSLLAAAKTTPQTSPVEIRLENNNRTLRAHGSIFRDRSQLLFLVRLSDPNASDLTEGERMQAARPARLIEAMPDGFVVLDENRRINSANNAFREMVQLATSEQLRDQFVGRWLGRTDVDLDVLFSNLEEHGSVSRYKMTLRSEYGRSLDVEISGVGVSGEGATFYGLVVRRDFSTSAALDADELFPVGKSVEDLKHLVGRTPLRELVRQTTDIVERMCIQAALELTSDNRASAAEMLGLSRQSLYLKLRRHNMAGFGDDPVA